MKFACCHENSGNLFIPRLLVDLPTDKFLESRTNFLSLSVHIHEIHNRLTWESTIGSSWKRLPVDFALPLFIAFGKAKASVRRQMFSLNRVNLGREILQIPT